jgi:dephospho-CoA kinase
VTIAVTGPFASGKSTFVRLLGELGAETVSADEIVHDLLAEDRTTISRVVERFGDDVRGERGVNRRALGRKVFGDPEALRDLEDILHPLVRRETQRRIAVSESGLFVAEVPLLFEGGSGADYDYTVAVVVPEERRRAWAAEAALMAIETRQLPQEEKARRADIVVQNDGDVDKLKKQAEELEARSLGGSVFEQEE